MSEEKAEVRQVSARNEELSRQCRTADRDDSLQIYALRQLYS